MRRIFSAVVFLIALTAPAWAGYDEGVAAYIRGDFAAALREWRPLAKLGQPNAQNYLGVMYQNGQGVQQDYVEAVRWYRKAAEQGDAITQYNLGVMYLKRLGCTPGRCCGGKLVAQGRRAGPRQRPEQSWLHV